MADETKVEDTATNTETDIKAEDTVPAASTADAVLPETGKVEDKTPEAAEAKETSGEDDNGTEDEPTEFDPTAWSEERDDVADSVFQLLHEGGATPDEAKSLLYDAVQSGKVEAIDRDALVEKVGKARATLILAGVKNFINERTERTERAVAEVHKAAGGKKAWEQVAKWVNTNQPAGLDEYRAMIDEGGTRAALAVQALVKLHNADPKTTSIGKQEIMGDGPSNKQQQGISQREYGDRLVALTRSPNNTEEARSELRRLRRLGKEQGL